MKGLLFRWRGCFFGLEVLLISLRGCCVCEGAAVYVKRLLFRRRCCSTGKGAALQVKGLLFRHPFIESDLEDKDFQLQIFNFYRFYVLACCLFLKKDRS